MTTTVVTTADHSSLTRPNPNDMEQGDVIPSRRPFDRCWENFTHHLPRFQWKPFLDLNPGQRAEAASIPVTAIAAAIFLTLGTAVTIGSPKNLGTGVVLLVMGGASLAASCGAALHVYVHCR